MQNKLKTKDQSPVKTGIDVKPPVQSAVKMQNTGKFVDSRRELGPEDGQL